MKCDSCSVEINEDDFDDHYLDLKNYREVSLSFVICRACSMKLIDQFYGMGLMESKE